MSTPPSWPLPLQCAAKIGWIHQLLFPFLQFNISFWICCEKFPNYLPENFTSPFYPASGSLESRSKASATPYSSAPVSSVVRSVSVFKDPALAHLSTTTSIILSWSRKDRCSSHPAIFPKVSLHSHTAVPLTVLASVPKRPLCHTSTGKKLNQYGTTQVPLFSFGLPSSKFQFSHL